MTKFIDVESLFSIIKQKRDKLNNWANSEDEEIQHDFILSTGDAQLWYKGQLDTYDEILKLIEEQSVAKNINNNNGYEYILCAAIWYNDGKLRPHNPITSKPYHPDKVIPGVVVCGHRHGQCVTTLSELFPNREYITNNMNGGVTIQGFLTSDNRFVNREEAGKIAYLAGQINKETNCLFSEDLY